MKNIIKELPYLGDSLVTPKVLDKLQELTWSLNPTTIIEVGTFLGTGSTKIFHDSVIINDGQLICIDHCVVNFKIRPGFGQIQSHYHLLLNNLRQLPNAQLLRARSLDAAAMIEDKIADLVFIDAGHSYSEVKEDIKAWLCKVRKGGILCGDDYQMEEVASAVEDTLGDCGYSKVENDGRIWWITVRI